MEQMDSMTLDIVAMLFDQIFGDENIPIAMKGLIGRLQIPMLKVAILDKNFFSKKTHPARQLLDVLGEIAVGLNAEFDQASPLYKRIDKIVQRLVDGFQDSMDIFDPLREELEGFIAEENRRAEEEAKINARRIEHREKLEIAKGVAQQEILQRAKSGTIPRAVLKFLAEQWVKLLLVAHAKRGDGQRGVEERGRNHGPADLERERQADAGGAPPARQPAARIAQAAEHRDADGGRRRGDAQALLRQAHALPHQGDEQRRGREQRAGRQRRNGR